MSDYAVVNRLCGILGYGTDKRYLRFEFVNPVKHLRNELRNRIGTLGVKLLEIPPPSLGALPSRT